MNLADTRFGAMMMARASAGTFTPSCTVIVTLTSLARGWMDSMCRPAPDHPHVVTRVQANRRREVSDDLVALRDGHTR